MSITTVDVCPRCRVSLISVPGADPWCGTCEWNLDSFPAVPEAGWVWSRMLRWDSRAGFRADRLLAELARGGLPAAVPPGGYRVLLAVSAVLMAVMTAAAAAGAWLVLWPVGFWHVLLGLLLLWAAWILRPRFGRLKRLLRDGYRVRPENAPALHEVMALICRETGGPLPDVVAFDFSWNAGAAVVGLRRTRVLIVGVPLLLALEPQQLVAVLAHELGHFQHQDGRRAVLTRPALTTFGAWSAALRPPRGAAFDLGLVSPQAAAFLIWQLIGGSLSLLLWSAHVGLHLLDARDQRRMELRADATAVRVAGSTATLEVVDLFAMLPGLRTYVQHHVPPGQAAVTWRRMLAAVRKRESGMTPVIRQHSIRAGASLFASHPTPGAGTRHCRRCPRHPQRWCSTRTPRPASSGRSPRTPRRCTRRCWSAPSSEQGRTG